MTDNVDPIRRSQIMSKVRSFNTKPEMIVRRTAHKMGFRYRLHCKDVPGKPDLVFRSRRKVIFVHGCFWHRHEGCPNTRTPKSRIDYWEEKFLKNQERDQRIYHELDSTNWKYKIIWECETKNIDKLKKDLQSFLNKE